MTTTDPVGKVVEEAVPDAKFWAAVAIAQGGSQQDALRVAAFMHLLPLCAPAMTPDQWARAAIWVAAGPGEDPDQDYGSALLYLGHVQRTQNPTGLTPADARALLLGVHAGMAAEELWECVHGAPWPPEATLLTLGALRDPVVAAAIAEFERITAQTWGGADSV